VADTDEAIREARRQGYEEGRKAERANTVAWLRTPEGRIAVALHLLRKAKERMRSHSVDCQINMDPDCDEPCTCGVDAANVVHEEVTRAIEALEGGG